MRILLVEDEIVSRKKLEFLVRGIGHEPLVACDGAEGFEIWQSARPDIVITDWIMPRLDGLQLCKRIRDNERGTYTYMIMVTSKSELQDIITAMEHGADDFITKPYAKEELFVRIKAGERILREHERSHKLLLNVLPARIAEELKVDGSTEPELFENVTVYLCDIVNFTQFCAGAEPKTIITELNEIFTAFDNNLAAHKCERIKTIGDAYMGVCGMSASDTGHARNIICAALDNIAYLESRNLSAKYTFHIRTGIHSGNVVGGVVGINKYIYDIFGDTINMASRLEESCPPMEINVSQSTYALARERFNFIEQGWTEIKGKGPMRTYLIKGGG